MALLEVEGGLHEKFYIACEAGVSIKPGAQAPGSLRAILPAHEMGDGVERPALPPACAGSLASFDWSWGSRPRLYAYACFAG